MKAELEAAGWTEERINTAIEAEEDPTTEELRSLFGPLADIEMPPFAPLIALALAQLPAQLLGPFIEEIGRGAFDELKSGARAPTGSEVLALLEFIATFER